MACPLFKMKGPVLVPDAGRQHPPAFPLKHQQKDIRLALALGERIPFHRGSGRGGSGRPMAVRSVDPLPVCGMTQRVSLGVCRRRACAAAASGGGDE